MTRVEMIHYTKSIHRREVLRDINQSFEGGNIYGLYGRNASGKTMLLRAISGLIYPTNGEVVINNKILHKDMSFPESLGIVIEQAGLLPQYTGFENLKLLAKIKKIASDDDIRRTLTRIGLEPDDKRHVRAYSLGMKQKLAIAQALFESPEIILLDEPTNALDDESVQGIRKLLLEEKERGALVIVASHNKDDLRILADRILHVSDGQIVDEVQKDEL